MTVKSIKSVSNESDAAAREQELRDRITRVLSHGFCGLADYIKAGEPRGLDPLPELVEHATALAEVLSHVDTKSDEIEDDAVPKTAHLLYSILLMAREIGRVKVEADTARHKAEMGWDTD